MSGPMERLILALVLLQMHQSDHPSTILIDRRVREEQLVFQGLTGLVIQLELDLERSIGQPASLLEELDNLVDLTSQKSITALHLGQ